MTEDELLKAFEQYKGYELGDFDIATCIQFECYKEGYRLLEENNKKINMKDTAIEFANWLNNNWYIPSKQGFWKLHINDEEYQLQEPKINVFNIEELFSKFENGEGEFSI